MGTFSSFEIFLYKSYTIFIKFQVGRKMHKIHTKINSTHLSFILKGLLIGTLTGTVVGVFRLIIEKSLSLWLVIYRVSHRQPLYLLFIVIISIIFVLIIGFLTKQQPHIMGSGIPEVEGQLSGQMTLTWWKILWRKFITGVLGIGSGLFLGREGPSIQLGAAIGQGWGQYFEEQQRGQRILLASGAAAGLSAAFNAPIAGTLFILEEVYHNFSPLIWMSALASSVSADVVSMNISGLAPVLYIPNLPAFPLHAYWHLIVLGILLGISSYFYQIILLWMPAFFHKFLGRVPRAFHGLLPFLLVIPIGFFWPETLGGGNNIILGFNQYNPSVIILLGLLLLRFIFSMISYGSGLAGGIFLPILTIGAITGMLYGTIMQDWGLLDQRYIIDLMVFSMAAYFAGIGKAPFTAILLITEMVGSLQHLVPLAILSLTAYIFDDLLGGAPIYESLLSNMEFQKTLKKLSGKLDQVEIPVFDDSKLVDQQVRDIKWPKNSLLSRIRQGEKEIIPHGDTIIHAGDCLIVLTDTNQRFTVKKYLHHIANT